MAVPNNLTELYVEELQDLWSANSQMMEVVREMAKAAEDRKLGDRLDDSADGIRKHADMLRDLITAPAARRGKSAAKAWKAW